jgi:hypothetical protein
MKYFSTLEAPSEKFVKLAIEKMGGKLEEFGNKSHPQEDFLLKSEKHPIFVVADGVTLIQYILDKKDYPNPSPAGEIARIFCEELIRSAESVYETFQESNVKDIFIKANEAVGKYNKEHGRTKETVDYWDNDFYAITAAFVVIKENVVYWGSICDSYVAYFDKNGVQNFISPKCNDLRQVEPPKFTGDPSDRKAKTIYTWSTTRNGINENGGRIGYGVVTGEPEAGEYLSSGSFQIKEGDLVTVLTDGFEDHLKLPDFISLFTCWPSSLESEVREFTHKKAEEDPETFGHERSLFVIRNEGI